MSFEVQSRIANQWMDIGLTSGMVVIDVEVAASIRGRAIRSWRLDAVWKVLPDELAVRRGHRPLERCVVFVLPGRTATPKVRSLETTMPTVGVVHAMPSSPQPKATATRAPDQVGQPPWNPPPEEVKR